MKNELLYTIERTRIYFCQMDIYYEGSELPTMDSSEKFIYVGENFCQNVLQTYGSRVTVLCYGQHDERFICGTLDQLKEYIAAPSTETSLSYKITGYNGVPHFNYHLALKGWNFQPTSEYVDYHIYGNDGTGKPDWTTYSKVKSVVDNVSNIADKSQLGKIAGQYMAKEYPLNQVLRNNICIHAQTIILKPVGKMAFGGTGIQIINKGDKVYLERRWKYVACEYVKDIMTYMDRKFHLRAYLFVTSWGSSYLVPEYRVITAKLPYRLSDWKNKDIHDTHLDGTDQDYFFSPDGDFYLEKSDIQIKEICAHLANHVKPRPFPESQAAYEMLGLDFLILKDGSVVLLEVNTNAGIKCVNSQNRLKAKVLEVEIRLAKQCLAL